MKLRATLVVGDLSTSSEFEITKTKAGKFNQATQKNLEQLLYAVAAGNRTVIFSPPVEMDSWLCEALTELRVKRRIVSLVKYVRDRYNGSLVGAHNCVRQYINPTDRLDFMEPKISLFLAAIVSGRVARQVKSLSAYYNQAERSTELENRARKGEFGS